MHSPFWELLATRPHSQYDGGCSEKVLRGKDHAFMLPKTVNYLMRYAISTSRLRIIAQTNSN
jgi:hypothetical protein